MRACARAQRDHTYLQGQVGQLGQGEACRGLQAAPAVQQRRGRQGPEERAVTRLLTIVDTRVALDLEALLHWAVGRELADLALAGGGESASALALRSRDGCAELLRRYEAGIGGVGATVSAAGAAMAHPDALMIWARARELLAGDWPALTLVRDCARRRQRPDWGEGLPVVQLRPLETVLVGRGWRARERVTRGGARWCPLRLVDNGQELLRRRALYRVWWRALSRLQPALAALPLSSRRCTAFRAPERPWAEEGA